MSSPFASQPEGENDMSRFITKWHEKFFTRTPVKQVVEEQKYEAEVLYVQHAAAAEHHAALAEMYRNRMERLSSYAN